MFTAKGAIESKRAYIRAHELAESSGEPQQRFEALYGVWQSNLVSGGIAAASPLSERLLRIAEREGDDGLRLQAHHSGWSTWCYAGDPAKTREHTDAGRLLYDPNQHASHRLVYGGHDPGVCAGNVGAQAEWFLGYPEKAVASIADTLALAERIAHPFTLGLVHASLPARCGRPESAQYPAFSADGLNRRVGWRAAVPDWPSRRWQSLKAGVPG